MMKYIQSFLLYIGLFVLRLVAVIAGLFVVPIAYMFKSGDKFPRWAWLWDNKEDGIYGPRWFNQSVTNFTTCYKWSAIRNPANNMRFIDLFNVTHKQGIKHIKHGDDHTPNPQLSRALKRAVWHFTLVRQKGVWCFSFWYLKAFENGRHFRIRLGWKCTPEWIENPRDEIYRDSGITFQFLPYRKG